MKKAFAAITLAGTVAFAGAVPAMADHEAPTYPGGTTQATVSDGTVAPGEAFTFSGAGFEPGEAILITVTATDAPQSIGSSFSGGASLAVPAKITVLQAQSFSTTADSAGAFSFPVTMSEPGTYTLTAEGLSSGHTVTATVAVAGTGVGTGLANTGGNNSGAGVALANTGADSSLVLWSLVGAGALAAGATSVVIVRRRAKA